MFLHIIDNIFNIHKISNPLNIDNKEVYVNKISKENVL